MLQWWNQVIFEIVPLQNGTYIFSESNLQITNGMLVFAVCVLMVLFFYAVIGVYTIIKFLRG